MPNTRILTNISSTEAKFTFQFSRELDPAELKAEINRCLGLLIDPNEEWQDRRAAQIDSIDTLGAPDEPPDQPATYSDWGWTMSGYG